MPVKICTRCGAEYLPQAQACADCGGRLEYLSGDAGPAPVAATASRVAVFLGPYREACRLRETLERQEIDGWIEERHDLEVTGFHDLQVDQDRPGLFEVMVMAGDRPRAEELRQRLDLPAELIPEGQEFVEGRCPACGFTFSEDPGLECPDCGLVLGGWADDGEPGPDADQADQGSGWLPHF